MRGFAVINAGFIKQAHFRRLTASREGVILPVEKIVFSQRGVVSPRKLPKLKPLHLNFVIHVC